MPALNFYKQFADAVESGEKTQAICEHRKAPIKVGDMLYLFTGMGVESPARRLGTAVCRSVRDITITDIAVWVDGKYYDYNRRFWLAREDGFDDACDFRAWFRDHYGLPFHGQLIVWDKPEGKKP